MKVRYCLFFQRHFSELKKKIIGFMHFLMRCLNSFLATDKGLKKIMVTNQI